MARLSYSFVYPDRRGRNVMRQVRAGPPPLPSSLCCHAHYDTVLCMLGNHALKQLLRSAFLRSTAVAPAWPPPTPHPPPPAPRRLQVGTVHSTRLGADDMKSLKSLNFQTGGWRVGWVGSCRTLCTPCLPECLPACWLPGCFHAVAAAPAPPPPPTLRLALLPPTFTHAGDYLSVAIY